MKTATEIYKLLINAQFSQKQANALAALLGEPVPDYIEAIDKMLVAKPFVPFKVRCGTTDFEIKSLDQGRFNRFGSFEVRNQGDGKVTICFNDHITLVEPL